jgi:hypothetical protein
MIILNGCNILLELADFCICSSNFLVVGSKTIEFGGNSPVLEAPHMLEENQELRVWPSEYRLEPMQEWSRRGVIGSGWRSIDGNDMWGILGPILGGKAGNVSIVTSFDPFGWEVEAGPNGDFEVWELRVFNIPFRGLVIL